MVGDISIRIEAFRAGEKGAGFVLYVNGDERTTVDSGEPTDAYFREWMVSLMTNEVHSRLSKFLSDAMIGDKND